MVNVNRSKSSNSYQRLKVLISSNHFLKASSTHSTPLMLLAGFEYNPINDIARCDKCRIEVSNWTKDMNPFNVHVEYSPNCPSVLLAQSSKSYSTFNSSPQSITALNTRTSKSDGQEQVIEHQHIQVYNDTSLIYKSKELKILKEARIRTFSHWSQQSSAIRENMINAGFFSCNVGDRVICLYCNIIAQQWKIHEDDPCEVHKTLSPKCPYVISMLASSDTASSSIVNEDVIINTSEAETISKRARSNSIVVAEPCHAEYSEIADRQKSFTDWLCEAQSTIDEFAQAGFFYVSAMHIVTCFFCNGSLHTWDANFNPIIEHVKCYPLCTYAKQICGEEQYIKIQESLRNTQDGIEVYGSVTNPRSTSQIFTIPDENTLSRYIAARLDLPISQRLLDENFKLSIIKRCWQDQLRLKQDDFKHDYDLRIACIILQKQVDCIDGKQENIIIPNKRMRQIREAARSETDFTSLGISNSTASSNNTNVPNTVSSNVSHMEQNATSTNIIVKKEIQPSSSAPPTTSSKASTTTNISLTNACLLCNTDERHLACIPCGHLVTCLSCSRTLRSCPQCRKEIKAFVRIFI